MALLPLLGALVLGQATPAQLQISAHVYTYTGSPKVVIRSKWIKQTKTMFFAEDVNVKEAFTGVTPKEIAAPVIRTLNGQSAEIKVEGGENDYSLRLTPNLAVGNKANVRTVFNRPSGDKFDVDVNLNVGKPTLIWRKDSPSVLVLTVTKV